MNMDKSINKRCSNTTHRLKRGLLEKVDFDYSFVVEVATRNLPKVHNRIAGVFTPQERWDILKGRNGNEQL